MKRAAIIGVISLAIVGVSSPSPAAVNPSETEKAFDNQISSADQLGWLKQMSSAPNQVGSPHDRANAEMQLALFKQWGWDARIETFQVLYPTPLSTVLELIAPERLRLGGAGADRPGRRDVGQSARRPATLCRLPGRWRRHRSHRLRKLRNARRLRRAG